MPGSGGSAGESSRFEGGGSNGPAPSSRPHGPAKTIPESKRSESWGMTMGAGRWHDGGKTMAGSKSDCNLTTLNCVAVIFGRVDLLAGLD